MQSRFWVGLIIALLIIFVGSWFLLRGYEGGDLFSKDKCVIEDIRETPVSQELAESVATNSIQKYYPSFDWIYVGNYLIYNSFGEPNYYLLVFRESDFTALDTLDKLEQNARLFSDSTQEGSDNKYQFSNVATVMTGSMKEDKLIQRYFRGIPEAIGKRLEVKEFVENKYPEKTLGNLVSDSLMDSGYYEIVEKDSKKQSGNLIRVYDSSIVSYSSLIKSQEDILERKQERNSGYSEEMCKLLKEGTVNAREAYVSEWNSFL